MFITFNGNCRQRHKCSVSSIAISAISWAVVKNRTILKNYFPNCPV